LTSRAKSKRRQSPHARPGSRALRVERAKKEKDPTAAERNRRYRMRRKVTRELPKLEPVVIRRLMDYDAPIRYQFVESLWSRFSLLKDVEASKQLLVLAELAQRGSEETDVDSPTRAAYWALLGAGLPPAQSVQATVWSALEALHRTGSF